MQEFFNGEVMRTDLCQMLVGGPIMGGLGDDKAEQ